MFSMAYPLVLSWVYHGGMKLFLSSFACKSLDKIYILLPKKPNDLRVAFIPTAADPYEDKDFLHADREKLKHMGFDVTDVDIKFKNEGGLYEVLSKFDLIAVAGGNTYYLLYHAQQSGFLNVAKRLIDEGTIYVGSSAGSILACQTIDTARRFDLRAVANDLVDLNGMSIVDFLIIPHFDNARYQERIKETVREWTAKKYQLCALTDTQVVIVDGQNILLEDAGK